MATQTDELALFKYNTATDGENVFSIAQALNENWDKIDTFATAIKSLSNLDAEGEKRFEDIWTELDKKLTAEVSLSENGYIKFNNKLCISWIKISDSNNISAQATITCTKTNPITYKTVYVRVATALNAPINVAYHGDSTTSTTVISFRNINTSNTATSNGCYIILVGRMN